MNDDTFQQVVSEYFQEPGAIDYSVPTGKDGEPLSPRGRELAQILEEDKLWKEDQRWRAKRKLQDNITWILDHQSQSEDAAYAYHTLLEVIQNCAEYHNETGKKAERLIEILQDPTILDE